MSESITDQVYDCVFEAWDVVLNKAEQADYYISSASAVIRSPQYFSDCRILGIGLNDKDSDEGSEINALEEALKRNTDLTKTSIVRVNINKNLEIEPLLSLDVSGLDRAAELGVIEYIIDHHNMMVAYSIKYLQENHNQ